MPLTLRIIITGLILLLIDWYFYQALAVVLKGASQLKRNSAFYIYWGFTVFSLLVLLTPFLISVSDFPKFIKIYVLAFVLLVFISKIIGLVFIALDDIIRLFRWIGSYFTRPVNITIADTAQGSHTISRLKFLNYIALGMAALPFIGFLYGMIKTAFDYKVHRMKVVLPNLPDAFNGLKIVQISDTHLGSFISTKPLEEAVKIINEQKADVIFFTGDLVNNRAEEIDPFYDLLNRITAPMGVYSILGNHDYGDYISWDNAEEKTKNFAGIKNAHARLGWKLLMNEHIPLKRNNAEIALIGVENWGANFNFPKYGNLKQAYQGSESYPVKILLSHDPSHWNHQVREEFKDIDLTFSGHTHGFQFGIEIPGFKWSPSQYAYKQWAGLYYNDNQHLYVNRGLGFLGYPGRVGILPEITVMELYKS